MGGDHGPTVVLPALAKVIERRPDVRFLIFGREDAVKPVLDKLPRLSGVSEFVHCEVAVRMDDKPSQALRHGRWKSSMWKAVEAVKNGRAEVCVSAGNTGALMAMSKFCLRTMANIDRPAIAALWPTVRGESVVLDVGATIGADAHQLIDFAILGAAMARALLVIDRPTVGLLNVGVEEIKGQEEVKEAGSAAARGEPQIDGLPGFRRGRRPRQGHGRRRRHRRLFRQYRVEDGRGDSKADRRVSARRDEPHADGPDRLYLRQERL